MDMNEEPDLQPIGMLPTIAELINGQYADSLEFVTIAREARARPHMMDDSSVDHMERVYNERVEWIEVYRAQLAYWRSGSLTAAQRGEVDRLVGVVDADSAIVDEILKSAAVIRAGTIERIMAKSDSELGLDALARAMHGSS